MRILLTERPDNNGYIESLLRAYQELGHEVCCDVNNFFYSNMVPDLLHIHWPERLYKWHKIPIFNEASILDVIEKRIDWYKANSTKIVHTIHNLRPHGGGSQLDDSIFGLIVRSADIIVHHCNNSVKLLADRYRAELNTGQKYVVCHHGDYLIHYNKIDKSSARSRYQIPDGKIVTINFGAQRPYKNEKFISDVFDGIDNKSKYLLVAGRFDYPSDSMFEHVYFSLRNRKRSYTKYSDRKYIYNIFPVNELPYIMACADIAFLGQRDALNSGFIALAATYSVPIVMPDIGCFRESAEGWIYKTYRAGDRHEAIMALDEMHGDFGNNSSKSNSGWLARNTWLGHARSIIEAANEVRT